MASIPITRFYNVSFAYPGEGPLFENLSFQFEKGVFYVIRGRSGTGKSTILRLINRLEDPLRGDIFFQETPISSYAAPALRRAILYIQQTPVVLDASVRDNLLLPFTFKENKDINKPDDGELERLLEKFHLPGTVLNRHAMKLSVGQRQRVCLIRGLILSPEMILLDEPTSALDEESSQVVHDLVQQTGIETGVTIVMVSHRRFQLEDVKPVVLELKDGRFEEGTWTP